MSWKVRETLTNPYWGRESFTGEVLLYTAPAAELRGVQQCVQGQDPVRVSSGDVAATRGRLAVQTFKPGPCQAASSSGYPCSLLYKAFQPVSSEAL